MVDSETVLRLFQKIFLQLQLGPKSFRDRAAASYKSLRNALGIALGTALENPRTSTQPPYPARATNGWVVTPWASLGSVT